MPRKFVKVRREFLEDRLEEIGHRGFTSHKCTSRVNLAKDLSKVQFDDENDSTNHLLRRAGLLGINTLENGLTFFGAAEGGDWEWPVFYIVYWDGKDLRGYIPKEGNLWNTDTKMAYGNCGNIPPYDDDEDNCDKKNWQKRFGHTDKGRLTFDTEKIRQDLFDRFEEKEESKKERLR